jgi:hypothetical protein
MINKIVINKSKGKNEKIQHFLTLPFLSEDVVNFDNAVITEKINSYCLFKIGFNLRS